ncbi:Aste57867_22778 [Aphanomyces stellatus]|uniref:Aste57867_22778 protein n=1 Tax=Aphanomyces stellatus TaxID=120398 RepID=A0A485LKW4_9STRA|nr:hypothetical protein As57867_022708 [Aphanomyces stellatus]VFT99431.1 Aste57867_22778 [Aphanomyces stellatus]
MFLAAFARPRHDAHRNRHFDGKIGIWPFVEQTVALRKSKNRPKGAIVTTPQSVDGVVYNNIIMNKVVPAIQERFPKGGRPGGIFVQQDNASPHKTVTTDTLMSHGVSGISMTNQPANSTDFNVLDLGFFNAIQSLQQKKQSKSIDELISIVEEAYYELPSETLGKTFVTLQKVMELAMHDSGGNNYKLPHMRKDANIKDMALYNVKCSPATYASASSQINSRS